MFVDDGKLHLVAEARDAEGRQVAVATRQITMRYKIKHASISCPEYVLKGETYECYITLNRGTGCELNCTIDGEHLPLELDGKIQEFSHSSCRYRDGFSTIPAVTGDQIHRPVVQRLVSPTACYGIINNYSPKAK